MRSRVQRCSLFTHVLIIILLVGLASLDKAALGQTQATDVTQKIEDLNRQLAALAVPSVNATNDAMAMRVAKERHNLLIPLMAASPAAAKSMLLETSVAANLPPSAQPYIEHDVEKVGTIAVIVEDSPSAHRRLFFTSASEPIELYPVGAVPSVISGSTVRITGKQLDNVLFLGGEKLTVLAPPVSNTFGAQATAVLLMNFQDNTSQPFSADEAQNLVFNTVNNFILENSQNQTWLTGDVFGYITLPLSVNDCLPLVNLAKVANAAAMAAQVDLTKYAHLMYVLPKSACDWKGASTLGGNPSVSAINGILTLDVVGHEMGHALGLAHSHALVCPGITTGANCTVDEYGDRFDIMGEWTPSHFNAFQKERLGWLNFGMSAPIDTAQTSGNYMLTPYEAGPGTKAVKVLRTPNASVGQRSWYYLEYRQTLGADVALTSYPASTTGVLLHSGTESDAESSELLNANPQDNTFAHAALGVGATFVDGSAGVSVQTLAADANGATVHIELFPGTGGCQHLSPSVAVTPTQGQAVNAGALVHFNVLITNVDTPDCLTNSYLLVATPPTQPSGWTAAATSTHFDLAPGASASTDLQITSPVGSPAGNYGIDVTVVGWPNFNIRTTVPITYTVSGVTLPDFAISAVPTTLTLKPASSGSIVVNSTISGGFSSAVVLSVIGLPAGVTAQTSPATISAPGSGSATITLTASPSAQPGTSFVTIQGSAAQGIRATTVSLTISPTAPALISTAVTPVNPTLAVGSALQLHLTGTYTDNSTSDVTNLAVWSSSNPAVVAVTSPGFAQAQTSGTATISAVVNGLTASTTLTVTGVSPPPLIGYTLLGTGTPVYSDGRYAQPLEMGLKFTSDVNGTISAIRFYKSATNFGTHVGELWTISGQKLASALFTNETASGWQQVNLPTPVAIQANTPYIVSYSSQGAFSYTAFEATINNGPLHAPVTALGGNGVFALGPAGTFPALGGGQNFLVDVVLTTGTSTATLVSLAVTPTNSTADVGASVQFHAVGTYSDFTTRDLTALVFWSSDNPAVATINSSSGIVATIAPGKSGISASLGSVTGSTTLTVSSTPPPPPPTTGYTLFGNSIPSAADGRYAQRVELGLKFLSDVRGYITAIRFYKTAANTGPHTASLWTVTGQLLASVPYTSETVQGWQQVNLPTPVLIQANTAYVASYSSIGGFSYVPFVASIDSGPLHAPVSLLGGNGTYTLGPAGTFPGLGGGQNYLVDVVFAPQ